MKRADLNGEALKEMGFRISDNVHGLITLDDIAEIIRTMPFKYNEGVYTFTNKEYGMCSTYEVKYREDTIECVVDGSDGKYIEMLTRKVCIGSHCIYAD